MQTLSLLVASQGKLLFKKHIYKAHEHILYCFLFSVHLFAVYLLHLEYRLRESKTLPAWFTAIPCALRTSVAEAGKGLDDLILKKKEFKGRKGQGKVQKANLPPSKFVSKLRHTCGLQGFPRAPESFRKYLTTSNSRRLHTPPSQFPSLKYRLCLRASSGWPAGWNLRSAHRWAGEPKTAL